VFRVAVAKVLAPDDFGVAIIALSFIAVIQVLNEFGLTAALIQKDERELNDDMVNTTFTASLIISLVLMVATISFGSTFAANYFSEPAVQPLISALALSLIFAPFSTVSTAMLYRRRKFKEIAGIRIAATSIGIFAACVLLLIDATPWVVIVQTFAATIVAAAGAVIVSKWKFRIKLDRNQLKQVFIFSGFVLTNDVVVSLAANAGVFVLGRLANPASVGLFSLATYMTDTVRKSIMSILNRVTFVHYASIKDNPSLVRKAYLSTLSWNCRAVFPIMMCFVLFGPNLVHKFLGPEWENMGTVVRWLAVSVMVHAAGGTTSTLYKAVGKPGIDLALFTATTILILLPSMYFGGKLAGIEGVAMAVALTKLISTVIRQIYLSRMIGRMGRQLWNIITTLLLFQAPMVVLWATGSLFANRGSVVVDIMLMLFGLLFYALLEGPRAAPELAQRFRLSPIYLPWEHRQ